MVMKTTAGATVAVSEFKNTAEWQSPTLGEVSEPVEERVGERKLTLEYLCRNWFCTTGREIWTDISGSQYKLYTVVRDGDFVYNKGTLSSSHKVAYTIFKVGVKLQHLMFLSAFA
nr:hypothetical protein [Klebsiella pneumoniae subsp. pneumoniae]